MRFLSAFSGCGWAYSFTLTQLPPHMLPQIWESWLQSLMQVCKPCHYALNEAVEPFKLHPMSMSYIYEVFEHLLRLWMGNWLHIHIITTTDTSPDLWELAEILPDASVQTHFTLVEAIEPFKLHPMSMSCIYEVFENLLRMWMGIWLHTNTVTTTDTFPDFGRLAEFLPDVW